MTLQALTYFVAVAEQKNFTKAAHQCFVTQPALSRAISDLEKELGRPLLLRGGKTIELTHAGRVCYEEARRILKQCASLVQRVQDDSDTTEGYINLGYLFNGSLNFLAPKLRQVSRLYPNVALRTSYEHFPDAKRMLHSGELDLVLLSEPNAQALGDVETSVVVPGGLQVVVHSSHRLFNQKSVTFEDIRNENFIFWDPTDQPGLYQGTMDAFHRAGIEPNVVAYGKKLGDCVAFVSLNEGLGVTTHAATESSDKVVHILPVSDCPTGFGVCLARLKNGDNPLASAFFAHIKLLEN